MKALIDSDVHPFLERAMPWLAREPVANNVLNTVAQATREGRQRHEDAIWVTVLDDAGEVVGAAMQTPPFRLFLCPMSEDAVQAVVEELVTERPDLIGVIGVSRTAAAFAEGWQQATGATAIPGVDQRLYSLADVIQPAAGPAARGRRHRPTATC